MQLTRRGGSLVRQLTRISAVALFVRGAGLLLLFSAEVCLARFSEPSQFGLYASIFALLNLLVLPAKAGMDTAAVRFVSTYRSQGDAVHLAGFILYAIRLVSRSAVAFAATWAAVALVVAKFSSGANVVPFLVASLALPCFAIIRLSEGIMRGLGRVLMALTPYALAYPLLLLAFLLVSRLADPSPLEATRMVTIQTLAFALPAGVLLWIFSRSHTGVPEPPSAVRRQWFRASMLLLAYGGFSLVLGQVDIVMIGALLGTEDAASYAVAWRVASLLGAFLVALNFALAPVVARHYAEGRLLRLERLLQGASALVLLLSGCAAVGLLAFHQQVLGVFGDSYSSARPILFILVVSQLVNVAGGPVGLLLNMTDHTRDGVTILAGTAVFNIIANLLLITTTGVVGAAIGTAISTLLWNAGFVRVVRRRLGVRVIPLPSLSERLHQADSLTQRHDAPSPETARR
jgi:O-antigen/teichoic acid export membrane protein